MRLWVKLLDWIVPDAAVRLPSPPARWAVDAWRYFEEIGEIRYLSE